MNNNQQEGRLRKYKTYISNLEWHIKTNDPEPIVLAECAIKISCYQEIVKDLEESPSPLTEDELKAKFAHYIGGENYTYDQLDTRERDTLEWVLKELKIKTTI